jgi:hypothetical protein
MISFGPASVTADYRNVVAEPGQGQDHYVSQICQALGGQRTEAPIAALDAGARTWLAYALCLYRSNKDLLPAGTDHGPAVNRLIAWAPAHQAMPDSPRDGFEREALTASGWTEAAVPRKLTLTSKSSAGLATIYSARPAPDQPIADITEVVAGGQATVELQGVSHVTVQVQPGVLMTQPLMLIPEEPAASSGTAAQSGTGSAAPEALLTTPLYYAIHDKLLPSLMGLIADEASYWRQPSGQPLATQSLELLGRVANLVQLSMAALFRPYADGWPAGPGNKTFRYSEVLKSTDDIVPSQDMQLGYLFNRAQVVGWGTGYGAPLATAGYDSGRDDDQTMLRTLLQQAIDANSQLRSDVILLNKVTAMHSPLDRNVYAATVIPSSRWAKGPAQWRWRTIKTLMHELLHKLAHPKYLAAAQQVRNDQVIKEGFVELLTVDCFTSLCDSFASGGSQQLVARLFEGVGDPGQPDPSFSDVGYGQAGQDAIKVREIVGNDNVRAAFFLGAVDLIGLKPTAQ